MEDMTHAELVELVRYHGAQDVMLAVRDYALEVYGDSEIAEIKCLRFMSEAFTE